MLQDYRPLPEKTAADAESAVSLRDILNLPQWNSLILPGWRIYHHPEAFRNRVWISLLLTVPVFIFSPYMPAWLHLQPPVIPGIHYISFVLGLLIYVYGGMVFIQGAYYELRHIQPGMMTLAALAISLTMAYSTAVTFGLPGVEIYLEMAVLTVLMLLGHWLSSRLMLTSGQILEHRAGLNPESAGVENDGAVVDTPVSELANGQAVLVNPGEVIPVDGTVKEGSSLVDESRITGSGHNVIKQPGDPVLAGSTNGDSELHIQTARSGPGTFLARSTRHIFSLQNQADRGQILAERAAYWLVIAAIVAASLAAVIWALQGRELVFIIERVAAVLVAVSPPALSLAIPMVFLVVSVAAMEQGIFIIHREQFTESHRITYAIFGKTGILTRGVMQLYSLHNLSEYADDELLQWAASLEASSRHPAARALVETARISDLALLDAEQVELLPGIGLSGTVDGRRISLGSAAILPVQSALPSVERRDAEREASLAGLSLVYMVVDNQLSALLGLADAVQENAGSALRSLHGMGIRTAIISGDSEAVTQRIAAQLDVINYMSGVTPSGKVRQIAAVQQREPMVAVVGHAISKTSGLAQADIALGMGMDPDFETTAAGVMLLKVDPADVPKVITMARTSHRRIMQNIIGASIYNALAIPLAGGILAAFGLVPPLVAMPLLMFASILLVIHNSRRLDRYYR